MNYFATAGILLIAAATAAVAQSEDPTPSPSPSPEASPSPTPPAADAEFETITYWKAELPGGTYVVAHDSIIAVSSQEYVLDGAARVTEVNISTAGVMQPRFYYIEPLAPPSPTAAGQSAVDRAKSVMEEAASRMIPGDPVWAKVIKSYPTTTHAGTIEYRLASKDQLLALFKSAEASWIAGRSEIFRTEGGGKSISAKDAKKEESENSADAFANPASIAPEPGGL